MRNQLLVAEKKIRLLMSVSKSFQASSRQMSFLEPKSVSNKQTQQQIFITECLCDHYTELYIDTLTKSMKAVYLDQMHRIGSEANELKEQEDRKLDSENELIWSNDLNISSDLQRQKNGVNHVDKSEYCVHKTKVANADCSFDGQGNYPL